MDGPLMLVEEGGAFPTENGLQDERNIDMMIAEMQGVSDVAAPKPIVGPADDAYSSIQDPLEGRSVMMSAGTGLDSLYNENVRN